MGSIGENLKEARERKGISLQQAEEDTKIRKRYLEALEDGDYEVIPGRVYVKGFLRNYAVYLGLDPEEILTEFKLTLMPVREEFQKVGTEPVISKPSRKRGRSERKGYLATVMIAGLAIVTVIIYNSFIADKTPTVEDTGAKPAVTDDSGANKGGDSGPAKVPSSVYSESQSGTPSPGQNGQQSQPPAGGSDNGTVAPPGQSGQNIGGVNITLNGKGQQCWTRVTVDGVVKFTGNINPGESKSFGGTGKIVITLGNAGAVEVISNGQNLGTLGAIGQVIKDREFVAANAPPAGTAQTPVN